MFNWLKKKPTNTLSHPNAYGRVGTADPLDDSFKAPPAEDPTDKVDSLSYARVVVGLEASGSADIKADDTALAANPESKVKAASLFPLPQISYLLELLPEEVIIKRIWSRGGTANKWLVKFHAEGAEYYDVKLEDAIARLFKNNKKVATRYLQNKSVAEYND